MATRYVYGLYDTVKNSTIKSITSDYYYYGSGTGLYSHHTYVGNSYTESTSFIEEAMDSPIIVYHANGQIIQFQGTAEDFKYLSVTLDGKGGPVKSTLYTAPSFVGCWHVEIENFPEEGQSKHTVYYNSSRTDTTTRDIFEQKSTIIGKGNSLLKRESTSAKNLNVGYIVDNSTWREFLGSDIVDPQLITYSKNDLQSGESISLRVTPRVPTYGGTIYYQYQYSTNGGNTWANIGSRTTSTNKEVTIPVGANQFQARVIASDGWGFTSSTPVKGQNLAVSQLKAYATVSGIHKAGVKMFVTVDGKAREISKGYATVGGIIRKLF